MNAEQFLRVQEVFEATVDLPQGDRMAQVEFLCSGNCEVADNVVAMLEEDARRQSLLDRDANEWLGTLAAATLNADHIRSLIQRQIGPYRLTRVLGEGGMGIVYLAERTDIGGLVAIKLLRDAWLSPLRRHRFALEQQTLVKLNHPSIARIYDANTMEDGTPWFVMEFADGQPFTEFLTTRNGSVRDDLLLFRHVCEAVAYAHSRAIIHRDIKPSNILVSTQGAVKLLDFGIAKQMDSSDTMARTTKAVRMMTPGYAAPEQLTGDDVGVFTDVYALGILLYETLAGRIPETEEARGDKAIEKPSAVARSVDPASNRGRASKREWADLDTLCLKALQPEPERRYGSVDAFLRDITAFLEGRVLEARPTGFFYVAQKFVARNRIPILIAAAAILLVIGSVSLFTVRLAKARNAAVAEAARRQRIQTFMSNMLGGGDREAAPSHDLKVVDLLDRELQQAAKLGSDKDTQAELLQTVGTMYNRLGKFEKAEQVLLQALERVKLLEVPPGPKLASILLQLATVQGDRDETKQARQTLQQVFDIAARGHIRNNDPIIVQAQITSGKIDLQNGDYQAAIDSLLPIAQRKTPYNVISPYDLRDCLSALAEAQLYTSQYGPSEATSRQVIDMDQQLLGENHPQTSVDLMNLGATKATRGEFAESEALYRRGTSILQSWYGADHPDVITAYSILAHVLISENKLTEAEAILRQTLNAQKRAFGPSHQRVAYTLAMLGVLASRQARPALAVDYLGQAVKIYRSIFGESNIRTASAESDLGAAYLAESKDLQAEAILKQANATYAVSPTGGNFTGLTKGRLGRALLRLHHYREAEVELKMADQLMGIMPHPPMAEVKNVRSDLAHLYNDTHRRAVAMQY